MDPGFCYFWLYFCFFTKTLFRLFILNVDISMGKIILEMECFESAVKARFTDTRFILTDDSSL